MRFGEKLYRLRKERGMSQETLAAELAVSRQAISRWELGEVVPDLLALACAFGLPFALEWVPGRWGIFLGQMAAVGVLVKSIKTLRLHYGLPWGRK